MMILNRQNGDISHSTFNELTHLIDPHTVIVLNNTKVFKARLIGKKETGGRVEAFLLAYPKVLKPGLAKAVCLLKASKRLHVGMSLIFGNGELTGKVLDLYDHGQAALELKWTKAVDLKEMLSHVGHVPLPPYIKRTMDKSLPDYDVEQYQTVYAEHVGAVAAPTAGLHFTEQVLNALKKKGVSICFLTLHVGLGTFKPVTKKDIRDHQIHSEWFSIPQNTADEVNRAVAEARPVLAVGTTCVRALEYSAQVHGKVKPETGECDLFIYPGFEFKVVSQILTNFHLPKSTLLMLVSAFAGRERILNAYAQAVREQYRFYSYGDCMWIR